MLIKMSIDEMVEKAFERMSSEDNFNALCKLRTGGYNENIKKYIKEYLEMSFNSKNTSADKNLEDLLITYAARQCSPHMHPMTCGVNSQHDLLVPRLVGHDVYLVCPTCGYLQIAGRL
jgi:hypothetical protein